MDFINLCNLLKKQQHLGIHHYRSFGVFFPLTPEII